MRKPTTVRLDDQMRAALEELARRTRRDFSSIVNEMLEESLRMRRVPGILFADGPAGRRARVAGTGLEVFEVTAAYEAVQGSWDRLKVCYPDLSDAQLRAALAYAQAYPEEIAERLAREREWTPEAVYDRFPFMRP